MDAINWQVRIRSPKFWLTLVPALLIIAERVLSWFGVDIASEMLTQEAEWLIKAVFYVLVILGIVTDPTTEGVKDSREAMTYTRPKENR